MFGHVYGLNIVLSYFFSPLLCSYIITVDLKRAKGIAHGCEEKLGQAVGNILEGSVYHFRN